MATTRKTKRDRGRRPNPTGSITLAAAAEVEFIAAAAAEEGEAPSPPKFKLTAYTGGPMNVAGFFSPVVIDLQGMKAKAPVAVLLNHDPSQIVGHADVVDILPTRVNLSGVVSGGGEAAETVLASSKLGFPWRASVGASVGSMEFVRAGTTVKVNGRKISGPALVARVTELGEVSFVPVPADAGTSARVAARAANQGGDAMTFEQWLEAKGFADVTEEQTAVLQAAYDAEMAQGDDGDGDDKQVPEPEPKPDVKAIADPVADLRASMRTAAAEEATQIAAIRKLATGHPEIEAKAIAEGWSAEKTELEVLRAARPTAPNVHTLNPVAGPAVLNAAVSLAGGISGEELVKEHGEPTVEAARKQFRHGISLQQLFLEAAWANGYTGRSFRGDMQGVLRAAFSTTELSGILSNNANKFLLAGFNMVEQTWRAIASIRPVKDFKTTTSYRMTGDMKYEQVGPGGELKHAVVNEESYTNIALTYGKMFAITRTEMINDDLGALTDLPRRLGRGAGLAFNEVFWTEFIDNATFFTAANGSRQEGAGSALALAGLNAADAAFIDQEDTDGDPLGMSPKVLLVPSGLKATGEQLMRSTTLIVGGGSAAVNLPDQNPHAGAYDLHVSAYLNKVAYTGYSATAWYLLADPRDLPTIEVVFLNGQQEPTVESADVNFEMLGVQFRGFHDFGVNLQDYRGGVANDGA